MSGSVRWTDLISDLERSASNATGIGVHPLPQHDRSQDPAGKLVHVILHNYYSHKHPKVQPGSIAIPFHLLLQAEISFLAQRG